MPPLNLDGVLMQKPACDRLLELLADGDSILALACSSKKAPIYVCASLLENKRLLKLFVESLEKHLRLLQKQSALLPFYKADTGYRSARSLGRFTKEIVSFIPVVGDVVADHFGYHIPGPGELWESFSHANHLPELHAEIDAAYANGSKIDKLTHIMRETGGGWISSKETEHGVLNGKFFDQFLLDKWQSIGIGLGKVILTKAFPPFAVALSCKKVWDIIETYHSLNTLLKAGLNTEQRQAALHFQRLLRHLALDKKMAALTINTEYRKWLLNFSLLYISKAGIQEK